MKKLYVSEILSNPAFGSPVELLGWVSCCRNHHRIAFLDISDSTGTIQAVLGSDFLAKADPNLLKHLNAETAVKITGQIVSGKKGAEIETCSLEVIGPSSLHISPKPRSDINIFDEHLQEQLLEMRHFYLRNPKNIAILKFRHVLARAVHAWFDKQGFIEIHAPILTPTPLYDDKTPIGLDVHGQHVFLTQCVGFYLEQAVHALEKIYNIGPSFRNEEGRSKRHLMEYWHIKAEWAFANFEDLAALVESFIHDISVACAEYGQEATDILGTEYCLDGLNTPFPRIDYCEAICWLKDNGADIEDGKSLGSDEEALLSTRFGNTPFWVVGIPRKIEPFPYVVNPDDPQRTMTADLIASHGFGELLGIAEKIHTLEMLDDRLDEKGKAGDPRYEWLRDLRKYGCVPHGGFGMGLERFIRWLLNIPHVRDTIPFHRAFGRKINP